MTHLLESCTYAAAVWDKGAMGFRWSDRKRGRTSQTLHEWHPKDYKNPIMRKIWDAFPSMAMWFLWKERNARIFKDQRKYVETVWKMMKENLLSSIRCIQWHDQDNIIPHEEVQMAVDWGLDRTMMEGL